MATRSSHHPLTFRVAARTNIGRCRDHNEDAFSIAVPGAKTTHGPPSSHATLTGGAVVCGVFDGCGSSTVGNVPSQVVARAVEEMMHSAWSSMSCEDLGSQLGLAVQSAGQRLFMQPVGMGTTATLVAVVDNHIHLAHIGDSRAYLFRNGGLMQLSRDHTLVADLLETGRLKPEDVVTFSHKNVIVRALGMKEHVAVDTSTLEVQPGDKILLCSDGVSTAVDDTQLTAILRAATTLEAGCSALIDAAELAGGHDNETVVLLAVEGAA
jgi:PPM family protein phosphatase